MAKAYERCSRGKNKFSKEFIRENNLRSGEEVWYGDTKVTVKSGSRRADSGKAPHGTRVYVIAFADGTEKHVSRSKLRREA